MGEMVKYYTYAELNERRMKAEEENRQLKKERVGLYTETEYRELEKERDEWEQKYLDIT